MGCGERGVDVRGEDGGKDREEEEERSVEEGYHRSRR